MSATEGLTDTQRMLRDSLEKYLSRAYSFEQRQAIRRAGTSHSAAAWSAYADMGLLALAVDEEAGGLGGDLEDLGLVAETLGAALTLEPFIPTAVFGARLIAAAGSAAQKAEWLPRIAAGEVKVALAHGERDSRYDLDVAATVAEPQGPDGNGFRLSGRKSVVHGGDAADLFVVSARTGDAAGLSLFLLPADAKDLQRQAYRNFEGSGEADLVLDGVMAGGDALLGPAGSGTALLQRAVDEAAVLDCMDAVGAMRAVADLTLNYVKTRSQFGAPIGNFQVIQHRLVDMMVAQEMASAMTRAALSVAASGAPADELARMASAAKVRTGASAKLVAQEAVQLHGGMGLTQEYPASHYFARLGMFERRWGDSDFHLRRFAEGLASA